MNYLVRVLTRLGLLTPDLDYHLVRASMAVLFLFFGYQKWFAYEAQVLIPYISNGPLIFWLRRLCGRPHHILESPGRLASRDGHPGAGGRRDRRALSRLLGSLREASPPASELIGSAHRLPSSSLADVATRSGSNPNFS